MADPISDARLDRLRKACVRDDGDRGMATIRYSTLAQIIARLDAAESATVADYPQREDS